jgi:hypothetical protein
LFRRKWTNNQKYNKKMTFWLEDTKTKFQLLYGKWQWYSLHLFWNLLLGVFDFTQT